MVEQELRIPPCPYQLQQSRHSHPLLRPVESSCVTIMLKNYKMVITHGDKWHKFLRRFFIRAANVKTKSN